MSTKSFLQTLDLVSPSAGWAAVLCVLCKGDSRPCGPFVRSCSSQSGASDVSQPVPPPLGSSPVALLTSPHQHPRIKLWPGRWALQRQLLKLHSGHGPCGASAASCSENGVLPARPACLHAVSCVLLIRRAIRLWARVADWPVPARRPARTALTAWASPATSRPTSQVLLLVSRLQRAEGSLSHSPAPAGTLQGNWFEQRQAGDPLPKESLAKDSVSHLEFGHAQASLLFASDAPAPQRVLRSYAACRTR